MDHLSYKGYVIEARPDHLKMGKWSVSINITKGDGDSLHLSGPLFSDPGCLLTPKKRRSRCASHLDAR